MNKKFYFFVFAILTLFFVLFLIESVSAVGMAGMTTDYVFFEPGLTRVYQQTVISNTDKPMDHLISVGGDLAQYFTLSKDKVFLKPGEQGQFTATLKLPQELAPGKYETRICALEGGTRGAGGTGGTSIGTRAGVCSIVTVFSPYPGKNADFRLMVDDVKQGDNATVVMQTTSYGKELVKVYGVIEVAPKELKAGQHKFLTLRTDERTLKTGETVSLNVSFNTSEMDVGEYVVNATLYYEVNQSTKQAVFKIGELTIEVLDFTKEVEKDKLNTLNVKVKSLWNARVDNVYASIDIIDPQKNAVKTTIKSPLTSVNAWETKNIVVYWDTAGFAVGEYVANVSVHYGNASSSKMGSIKIVERKEILSSTDILIGVLVVVTILLIILLLRIRMLMAKHNLSGNKPIRTRKSRKL
ncbi:MAG: hypothetical protein N3G19_00520 [Candidatus Pacearchaeota archaeon]|nr:hypothetical protein [Candidatus Pacearchaeota archaeon]